MGAVAAWAARHARVVLAVSLVLAVAAGVAATRLPTDAGTATLVDSDTPAAQASAQVREAFGDDPVVVLAEAPLHRLVLTANLLRLLRLEGCLAGNVPKGVKPIPGPCTELARMRAVRSLSGPATFLNEAVIAIDSQIRRLAAHRTPAQLRRILVGIASQYGITSLPSLTNPDFISSVVFDPQRPLDAPKARLAFLFPNSHSAQIVVRLRPDLTESERHRALGLIRAAVFDTTPRRQCPFNDRPAACFALKGGRYVVSGAPVVVDGLAGVLKDALLILFGVAVAVMAVTLFLVFRSRLRLLPLAVALAAAALTFGLLGLVGGSLTMASIAVLPILIGLAVDYAIQLQARYDEAIESGLRGADAARRAAASGGPTIGIACLATGVGLPGFAAVANADGAQLRATPDRRHRNRFRLGPDSRLRSPKPSPGGKRERNGDSGGWRGGRGRERSNRTARRPLPPRQDPPAGAPCLSRHDPSRPSACGWSCPRHHRLGPGNPDPDAVRHPRSGSPEPPRGQGPERIAGRHRRLRRARRQCRSARISPIRR